MTLSELGSIGEFIGSILTLITLVYLAIQVRQNTRHVQAQMGHDGWLSVKDDQIAVMGDDAAEALAKVGLDNEPLTDRELKTVDAYYRATVLQMARVEHINSQGLDLYGVDDTARAFLEEFNDPISKAWWESNRTYIAVMAPLIGARVEELLAEPDCPSRAESLKDFKRRLNTR